MYKAKKILAIIPSKRGSIGIKDKNIKLLNNKPLIYYSIKAALDSKIFDKVFVSTDSEKYAKIAKKYGADVSFLRPRSISKNNSLAQEYIIHAISEFEKNKEKFDYFAILQPTSPLRTTKNIIDCADIIINQNLDSVVSVCETECPLEYCKRLDKNLSMHNFSTNSNRQDFEKIYKINGAIYFCNCKTFLRKKNFYTKNSKAYIMNRKNSVDIDEELDFKFAEFLLKFA